MPIDVLNPLDYVSGSLMEVVKGNEGYFKASNKAYWDHGTIITCRISASVTKLLGVNKTGTTVPGCDAQIALSGAADTPDGFIGAFCTAYNSAFSGTSATAEADADRAGAATGNFSYAILKSPNNEDTSQSHNDSNQAHVISGMKKGACRGGTDLAPAIADCLADAATHPGAEVKLTTGVYRIASDAGLYITGGTRDTYLSIDFGRSVFYMDGGQFQTGGDIGQMAIKNGVQVGRSAWSNDGTFGFRLGGYTTAGLVKLKNWGFVGWQDGPTTGVTNKPGSALLCDSGHAELDNVSFFGCTTKRCVASFHNVKNVIARRMYFYDDGLIEDVARVKNGAEQGWIGVGNGANGVEAGTLQGVIRFEDCWFDENYGANQTALFGGILIDPALIAPGQTSAYDTSSRMRHVELVNCQGRMSTLSGAYGVGVKVRQVDSIEMRGVQIQRTAGLSQHFASFEDVKSMRLIGCRGNSASGGDDILFVGSGTGKSYYERGCTFRDRVVASGGSAPEYMDVL